MKKFIISVAILAFVAVFALALTQTGNLIVTVMSEEGQMLPGASVTISSNVLMGTRTYAAGANGKATFRNLPPGDYTVEVAMDGFQAYRQTGVEVRVAKTTKADVSMKLGQAKEVIEVVGMGPLVDTTSNTVATEFDFDNYINHMPTYRHYTSVAGLAGGVISANNPSSAGAGGYQNSYLIDGTTSMDSRTHTWGNQFNVDTVADMNLIQGGATAEYGHAMGAIFNMVTKSGSNEITALGRLEMWRMNWNDLSLNNPARTDDDTRAGRQGDVWNISGGGPLYPDMIWWYVGYSKYLRDTQFNRRLNVMDFDELTPAIVTYYGHLFSIKGTLQLGENLKATVLYREDPIDLYNENSGRYYGSQCLPSADEVQLQGGDDTMVSASYIMSENAFLEASYSMDRTSLDLVAQPNDPDGRWTASTTTGPTYYSTDGWWWGAVPDDYHSARNSDTVRGAFNYLLESDSLGSHDIKVGGEWLDLWGAVRDTYYQGNSFIFTGDLTGVGFDAVPYYYLYTIEDRIPEAETHGKYITAYLQDSWQMMDNVTLNIGLRTDIGTLWNNQDDELISDGIFTALAPRVGVVFDLSGNALRFSAGRYYDTYNMYMVDNFNYYTTPETWKQYAPTDGVDGRNGWTQIDEWQQGTLVSPHSLDPNLTPQYVDEASLGFDYLITDTMALSLTGTYRYYTAVTREDPDGDRAWYWTNLETVAHGSASKIYYGAVLEFRKRPTEDNLFLNASLTYQHVEGFGSNTFRDTYFGNPYQTEANIDHYWGPCGDIGVAGASVATADYNWFAKAQGTYFFPNNWYIGVQASWVQGEAMSTYTNVAVPGYGNVVDYPNGLSDMDRMAPWIQIDVQFGIEQNIELPFDVPLWDDTILLGIYANIYNIIDNQDERIIRNLQGASNYGQPTAWYTARNYELGFRIEL
jgi:hypothetical protein